MNKKIGIFMVFVLLVGAVFLNACDQEAVGRRLETVGKDVGSGDQMDVSGGFEIKEFGAGPEDGIYMCDCPGSDQCPGKSTTTTEEDENGGFVSTTKYDCSCCGNVASS